jgi:phosphoglycerol transferase MdoB-like AlkP superfamily enzyme
MSLINNRNPYYFFIKAYIVGIIFFSLSRISLVVWQMDAVRTTDLFFNIFIQGIRVDLIQLSLLFLIPILFFPIAFINKNTQLLYEKFLRYWVLVSFTILLIIESCTPTFIMEYNVRPNILFIEYLKYPKEVLSMLFRGFTLQVILVLIFCGFTIKQIYKRMNISNNIRYNFSHLILWPFVVFLILILIRSNLGHRPANPAFFALTDNSLVNSIILNSPYSVFYAAYSMRHEANSTKIYGKMEKSKVLALTNQNGPEDYPTQKTLSPIHKGKSKNIVIILQESLGATFVESLGGAPVTPNIESLKDQGIWFNQLYASGTRSVRGIEAVISGFPPTPSQSSVKLPLSQNNFFTIASLLNEKSYKTSFIYGGESHFDNMRNFFIGNGFKSIIEQKDFTDAKFIGSWGASDQDLYNKAHEKFLKHSEKEESFFSLVFTSSNHAPFEFPENVISLYEQPQATEKNAVKYADHALGEYIKKARQSSYWNDTIFLIVADHDIRVRGDHLIPIKNFHIPGIILGKDIQPKVINKITSQIDLPVTLLSLAGVKANHPMIGEDMMKINDNYKGRAIMQYYENFAWMEKDKLVVLQPNKKVFFGKYDFNKNIISEMNDHLDYDKELAYSLLPSILYRERLYKLPPQ